MIAIVKGSASEEQLGHFVKWIENRGLKTDVSRGEDETIVGIIGDTTQIDPFLLESMDIIERVQRVTEPFKKANRKFHPEDTVIDCGYGVKVGGGNFQVMAGPCSVEGKNLIEIARAVKASGAAILRGGAFKPRTSPYDFSGLQKEGLALLSLARRETNLPVVSEIMSPDDLPLFENVDLLQVGARNMQNYDLLRALGRVKKPVLLKRGSGATLRELLLSAEYILSGGNENVILCERGIRTFSDGTRSTLDLSAVPLLHEMTHLPVVVDPSHAVGRASLVPPMALAAAACGADGLLIEVHNDPLHALCDGAQALLPEDFAALARQIAALREVTHR